MRIDKYLKVSRLIKRRTVANDACEASKIEVNGKVVKPSYDVKTGDIISLRFGDKVIKVEVLNTENNQSKEHALNMYRQID